jgi:hypothetical protein
MGSEGPWQWMAKVRWREIADTKVLLGNFLPKEPEQAAQPALGNGM